MNRLFFIVFIFLSAAAWAQDPQFTQFYANPLYLNPAYTGANACLRASTSYRVQWPSIPGRFSTYSLSVDQSVPTLNSGVGIQFMTDRAGSGALRTTSVGLFYAYEFSLTRNCTFRIGIKTAENIRAINYNDLIFGDQLARGGAATSIQAPPLESVSYLDFSSGLLAYSDKYWGGLAVDHLTQPNQSLVYGESILPIKYSLHGGAKIPVKYIKGGKIISVSPALNFRRQAQFNQMDIGFYFNDYPLISGLWYRGIPLFKSNGYLNNDGLALLVGLIYGELKMGYSYDFTTSALFGSSGGAHEIVLSYQFCNLKNLKIQESKTKNKKQSAIPCPNF